MSVELRQRSGGLSASVCGVCLALDATEMGDRPCSPRWRHRQSWRGQGGGTHTPRAKGATGRWARENKEGAALRALPKRGAPEPPQTRCRPDQDLDSQFTKWKRVAGTVFRQREWKRPRGGESGCVQGTGRREGRPEGGVRGESECRASRLARHGAPGHEGPRVQGQTAVTLSWRQRQPHGCLRGWKGSHQGAVPGRRDASRWQEPACFSDLLRGLGPLTPLGAWVPILSNVCSPHPPRPSPAPEQWPDRPGIWRRGARAGRGPSRGRWRAWVSPAPADTCEADCVRRRVEQSLQAAVKTLRKSMSRQLFSVQVAGTEYELAQRPAKAPEGPGACDPGHALQDSKCGESLPAASSCALCPSSPGPSPRGRQTRREGMGHREAPRGEALRHDGWY